MTSTAVLAQSAQYWLAGILTLVAAVLVTTVMLLFSRSRGI